MKDEFIKAYRMLISTTNLYREAAIDLEEEKKLLVRKRFVLLESGEIDGKNAEIREAQMFGKLADEHLQIDVKEVTVATLAKNRELASLEVELQKGLLRIEELSSVSVDVMNVKKKSKKPFRSYGS